MESESATLEQQWSGIQISLSTRFQYNLGIRTQPATDPPEEVLVPDRRVGTLVGQDQTVAAGGRRQSLNFRRCQTVGQFWLVDLHELKDW